MLQAKPGLLGDAGQSGKRRRPRARQLGSGMGEEVTCPKCQAGPNSPCTPHGPHHERVKWSKRGVLNTRAATTPTVRRTLGAGGRPAGELPRPTA
ncbi:zinc finger domain-containing protein [Streptomyces griseofuscus]